MSNDLDEFAKTGEKAMVVIDANEDVTISNETFKVNGIQGLGTVNVGDNSDSDGSTWFINYTTQSGDTDGPITFSFDATNGSGNTTTFTISDVSETVTYDGTAPTANLGSTNSATGLQLNLSDANNGSAPVGGLDDSGMTNETVSINTQSANSVTFDITSGNGGLSVNDSFSFDLTDQAGNTTTYDVTWDGSVWGIGAR